MEKEEGGIPMETAHAATHPRPAIKRKEKKAEEAADGCKAFVFHGLLFN